MLSMSDTVGLYYPFSYSWNVSLIPIWLSSEITSLVGWHLMSTFLNSVYDIIILAFVVL